MKAAGPEKLERGINHVALFELSGSSHAVISQ